MRPLALASAILLLSAPSFAQDSPEPGPRTSIVHVENGAGVVVEQQMGWNWVQVCDGSCDRPLLTDAAYRVSGLDIRRSVPFRLEPATGEPVQLVVSRASPGLHGLGISGIAIGAAAIGTGLMLLAVGAIEEQCSNCINGGWANTTILNVGWSVVGGGVLGLTIGIVLFTTNRRTTVASRTGDVLIPLTPGPERLREARAPAPALPPVLGLPIWGGTF